jgi:Reverse transcriptase (RNA-dependent DNA polymerase)
LFNGYSKLASSPTKLAWSVVILIPKGAGSNEVRGIGLLEVVWKLLTTIMNSRIIKSVEYHDAHHGFRANRGTGTATLEAKLRMQLAMVEGKNLFQIFIDFSKAYDTLDRGRTLKILEGYGIGPRILGILRTFWEQQKVVVRQSGYYGTPFKPSRGVTQGDVISPTIFNIVEDAIIRYWMSTIEADVQASVNGSDSVLEVAAQYYADDGLIASYDHDKLQKAMDFLVDLFERVGLKTNVSKTKAMTCTPRAAAFSWSEHAYKCRMTGSGDTYQERK